MEAINFTFNQLSNIAVLNAILFFLFIFRFIINETLPTSCHLLWIEPIMCCLFLLSMVKRQIEPIHFVSFRFGCGVARRHRKDVIHFHGLCVTDISLFFVCTFSDWEELKKISQYFFLWMQKKIRLKGVWHTTCVIWNQKNGWQTSWVRN